MKDSGLKIKRCHKKKKHHHKSLSFVIGEATDGLTWTGESQDVFRVTCSLTGPHRKLRLNTGRADPPYGSFWGLLSLSHRNSRATVQLSTDNSCCLQGPLKVIHWFPLSPIFHLQCSWAATVSSRQPDRFWNIDEGVISKLLLNSPALQFIDLVEYQTPQTTYKAKNKPLPGNIQKCIV